MFFRSFTVIFLLGSLVFLSGCARSVDLRQQAKEEKAQEQKSISSMQGAVDLEEVNEQPLENNLAEKEPLKILFVGDMMFDRHIREAVEKYGKGPASPDSRQASRGGNYNYIFEPIKDKLFEYDLVVGNLEGPITEAKSVSINTKLGEGKNFIFTFDPIVAEVLAQNNIRLVNLDNNHIFNQGEKGVEQTKKYLERAGVEHFDKSRALVKDFGGVKVGFVSYNYSVPGSEEKAVEDIKLTKAHSGIVIVCPHWGTEYKTGDPGQEIKILAREMIGAGADAIIGTHPHVIQGSGEYEGKRIYYSLGNFVFDQYFQKETMEGLGVELTIKPDGILEYNEMRFVMNKRGQTELKYPMSNF